MRRIPHTLLIAIALMAGTAAFAGEATETQPVSQEPTADEQIRGLETMCAASADDRAQRHEERSLYERLGKEEKIHALTREIVRLHLENDAIKHLVDESYADQLAERVALFMIAGMGGPPVYDGPSLTDSHRHMHLTNADFLAAGGDVIQAMKNLGYGQNEIDEVVCALVGLRDQVVLSE